jgi:hypothetical protein
VMFVGVSSPVAAKRTRRRRVEGSANYTEHKLCFCLRLTWRDSLKDKWPGIRSSFSKKVGWNAGLDPIVAGDANLAICCRCSSSAGLEYRDSWIEERTALSWIDKKRSTPGYRFCRSEECIVHPPRYSSSIRMCTSQLFPK